MITTHPIAGQVADTDATFLNFDGITYGKGASVIKQLVAAMGMEGFRAGLRGYFAKHAFGNTTLSQWLDALGEGYCLAGLVHTDFAHRGELPHGARRVLLPARALGGSAGAPRR